MTAPAKRKGDSAERELAWLISDQLGIPVKRMLGAGRKEDVGDLYGIDNWVIQVCDWRDVTGALAQKPRECEQQQRNAEATFGVTFIRQRGGLWRGAQTLEQWATVVRELS